MGETNTLLAYWPAWLAIILAALAALHQLITSSEKVANVLGRMGRWIYNRARRRYILDVKELNDSVIQAVAKAREQWETDEARALSVIEERLQYMTGLADRQQEELTELSFGHRCTLAYVEYEAEWHHQLQMLMVTCGSRIAVSAVPEHISYHDFERLCRESGNLNWHQWARVKR